MKCKKHISSEVPKLFQVSLLQSLMQGDFDGSLTLKELKENGDFGLGTFDRAAGEMVVLDGVVYRCKEDGSVGQPDDAMTTPFADVTCFKADVECDRIPSESFASFQESVMSVILHYGLSANSLFAVKASGHFAKVLLRSIPPQDKPYPSLEQVMEKDQRVFEFADLDGTLVGFFFPSYCGSFNTVGWHFHFISSDRCRGGHVLDFVSSGNGLKLQLCPVDRIEMRLPYASETFRKCDFSSDMRDAIGKVENIG